MTTFAFGSSRRQFLKSVACSSLLGVGALPIRLAPATAMEDEPLPRRAQGQTLPFEIESLVRLLEETPRDRVLEAVGRRIRQGLTSQELLSALMLAGVRNIEPRPVGYKFHAVMVVYPVHQTSLASPASDRWLPLLWAVDDFKQAQYWDAYEDDWRQGPVPNSPVPPLPRAVKAFTQAMDQWHEAAADAAVVGLARAAKPAEVFDLICRYGARDFRDIGHKAIYVASAWRTLQVIGWKHAEPILRSLAYALLAHEGANPAQRDAAADRPFRRNLRLIETFRPDWQGGEAQDVALHELLDTLRQATSDEACDAVVQLINRGTAVQAIWDGLSCAAAELMLRRPGIMPLHAVTATHALHMAYHLCRDDRTRRLLLLQSAAFLPLFRGQSTSQTALQVNRLQAADTVLTGAKAIERLFADAEPDRGRAAGNVLAYLQHASAPQGLMQTARYWLLRKGKNAHDYKFTAAILEEYAHLSPAWRDRYLAASVIHVHGSSSPDNPLVERARAALAG